MATKDSRWHESSPSQFDHERAGLAYIKDNLPDAPPYRAWTNFEFMDEQGRWHEVDALVLGQGRLHLIELKYYRGSLTGTEANWLRNGRSSERSPLLLTRRKAQRLASRITKVLQDFARKKGHNVAEVTGWVPFIQESVFLHHPDLKVDLPDLARSNLFSYPEADNDLPDIMDRLLEPAGSKPVADRFGQMLATVFGELGIMRRPTREAGSWLIEGSPLAEGDGWQDWPATHRQNADNIARIRVFPSPKGSPESAVAATRRRVSREYQLLQALTHDSIVTPKDQIETEDGDPGLVYGVSGGFKPLDLLLAEKSLTNREQLMILEQTAEALAYAHRHQVAHRGLNPHAILVRVGGTKPEVRLADWSWAGRIHHASTAGMTALGAPTGAAEVDGSDLYEAPEGRWSTAADRQSLDVFSLGAVAYHLLTGSPPASDRAGLRQKLMDSRGLDLAAADAPYADEQLRALVLEATQPKITKRLGGAQLFLERIRDVMVAQTAPDPEAGDPLDAAPESMISGRFRLRKTLGSGSTATGLLVHDTKFDDIERVLKVARNDEADERLRQEAEVLEFLGKELPKFKGIVKLIEPPLQLMGKGNRTALLLTSGGEYTLGELTRFDALTVPQLESLGSQLLEIVVALESAGVLHRDIKPANLGLTRSAGGRNHLTLFDFSLARGRVSSVHAGTAPYLDPFFNKDRPVYDSAAEWYAAAVVLFEMATTTTPLYGSDNSDPALLTDDVTVEPGYFLSCSGQPLLAQALTDFFRHALSRQVGNRFDTADKMLSAWKEIFVGRASAKGATGRPVTPRPLTTVPGPQVLPISLRTLGALTKELVRSSGKSGSAPRKLMYLLLPAEPTSQDIDPLITQGELGQLLNVTPARVTQIFGELHRKWIAVTDLELALKVLTEVLDDEMAQSGDVTTPDLMAAALLDELFPDSDATSNQVQRTALGLVRVLLEMSSRSETLWERRRYRRQLVTVGLGALQLDAADAVATVATKIVREAASVGQHLVPGKDVLPALRRELESLIGSTRAARSAGSIAGMGAADGDSALGTGRMFLQVSDQVLLRLAAIRTDAVGLSAASELHSADLSLHFAVATVLQGLPEHAVVKPDELRSRVAARFPMLKAKVPHRPALDDLVRAARPQLTWDSDRDVYRNGIAGAGPSTLPSRRVTVHSANTERGQSSPLGLSGLRDGPVFRAVQVPAGRSDDLAAALEVLMGAEVIDVTDSILATMRAKAEQAGVPWLTILQADSSSDPNHQGLASFVEQAVPEFVSRVERLPGGPVVLTDLATLAAYGLLGTLTKWTDLTTPPPRTILALVPRGSGSPMTVDGVAVQVNSPDQLISLSETDVDSLVVAAREPRGRRAPGPPVQGSSGSVVVQVSAVATEENN